MELCIELSYYIILSNPNLFSSELFADRPKRQAKLCAATEKIRHRLAIMQGCGTASHGTVNSILSLVTPPFPCLVLSKWGRNMHYAGVDCFIIAIWEAVVS